MNNMYDILNKFNSVAGKQTLTEGAKPDFLDLDKDGDRTESMKDAAKEVDEANYSAKAARAGKDIGKPGKAFAQIAKSAGERYGSKERGEKVAGAVLAKLRAKEDVNEADMEEGNDFTGARLAAIKAGKPTFKVDGKVYKVTGDTSDEKVMEREYGSRDDFDKYAKKGDTIRTEKGTLTKTDHGVRHERRADDEEDTDDRDDDTPKKKGRPKGSKRAIGAKVKGTSKLHSKPSIKEGDLEEDYDKDEYDEEGEMAKSQSRTIADAAMELHQMVGDQENLPEWVQKKITLAQEYIDAARDYLAANRPEEEMIPERELTKPEMKKREEIVKSMKKNKGDFEKRYGDRGEAVMYATATKQAKKTAEESKEEVEETTVAGSVATAPAEAAKGKKGMVFGKGVYESAFNDKLSTMLTEGMTINASQGENGEKSLTVSATDDDAVKLAQILRLAGMPQGHDYHDVCPACGKSPCGCEQELEEADLANSPEPEYSDVDTMINTLGAGLNGRKSTGQTTLPVINRDPKRQVSVDQYTEGVVNEAESKLWDMYKRYESQ